MDTIRIPIHRGGEVVAYATVDADMAHLAKFKWHLHHGYAARSRSEKPRTVRMHTDVLGDPPDGLQTDHRNRDRLDNRRENLRHVSHRENMLNRGRWGRAASLGLPRGVRIAPSGRFEVSVCMKGLCFHFGTVGCRHVAELLAGYYRWELGMLAESEVAA